MTYELHNKDLPEKDFHIFSLPKIFNKQDKLPEPRLNHNQDYIQKLCIMEKYSGSDGPNGFGVTD